MPKDAVRDLSERGSEREKRDPQPCLQQVTHIETGFACPFVSPSSLPLTRVHSLSCSLSRSLYSFYAFYSDNDMRVRSQATGKRFEELDSFVLRNAPQLCAVCSLSLSIAFRYVKVRGLAVKKKREIGESLR